MATNNMEMPKPQPELNKPTEVKSLRQEFKDWLQAKRQQAGPEPDEDYKKLSVAAVGTGVVIALVRQRMLERRASGNSQVLVVVPIAFAGLYSYTLWRDGRFSNFWAEQKQKLFGDSTTQDPKAVIMPGLKQTSTPTPTMPGSSK